MSVALVCLARSFAVFWCIRVVCVCVCVGKKSNRIILNAQRSAREFMSLALVAVWRGLDVSVSVDLALNLMLYPTFLGS